VGGATVIGVVADFNMHSLHERISPLRVTAGGRIGEVAVRITPHDIQATAKWIAEKGARFNNGKPLEYETFDERLGGLYTQEHKFAEVMSYATGLAIFVACLGIFGMSIFVCQQKVKEIGIRKVLGASLGDVYFKLTGEFVGLILLSALLAFPVASYLVGKWLQQFVNRVDIGMWDLLITALVDTTVVLATVSYQAIRAARANPVLSLRYE
jgi:putative ABC transport system permease protein